MQVGSPLGEKLWMRDTCTGREETDILTRAQKVRVRSTTKLRAPVEVRCGIDT